MHQNHRNIVVLHPKSLVVTLLYVVKGFVRRTQNLFITNEIIWWLYAYLHRILWTDYLKHSSNVTATIDSVKCQISLRIIGSEVRRAMQSERHFLPWFLQAAQRPDIMVQINNPQKIENRSNKWIFCTPEDFLFLNPFAFD